MAKLNTLLELRQNDAWTLSISGLAHTTPEKFENAALFQRFIGLPYTLIRRNWLRKTKPTILMWLTPTVKWYTHKRFCRQWLLYSQRSIGALVIIISKYFESDWLSARSLCNGQLSYPITRCQIATFARRASFICFFLRMNTSLSVSKTFQKLFFPREFCHLNGKIVNKLGFV